MEDRGNSFHELEALVAMFDITDWTGDVESLLFPLFQTLINIILLSWTNMNGCSKFCQFLDDGVPKTLERKKKDENKRKDMRREKMKALRWRTQCLEWLLSQEPSCHGVTTYCPLCRSALLRSFLLLINDL